MNNHNRNFEDKLNSLHSQGKLSIENAEKLDVYDDEFDGFVAFRIREFMNRGVDPETMVTIFYSKAEYILDRIKSYIPDMTMERLEEILTKMMHHGYMDFKDGVYNSMKVPMANMPLK